jgi:hypothetical protein
VLLFLRDKSGPRRFAVSRHLTPVL